MIKQLQVLILLTLFSTSSYAAVSTKLNVPAEPSSTNIQKAIVFLNRALSEEYIASDLEDARKLIAKTTKSVTYNAAVYVDGNKQFNNLRDENLSWNFSAYCYKGNTSEAVRLINDALKLGYWGSDEESIQKASKNRSKINLLIVDGPNDISWTITFGICDAPIN